MRLFHNTSVTEAEAILTRGFTDMSPVGDQQGVHFTCRLLTAAEGASGEVTLCLEVPDELFHRRQVFQPTVGTDGYWFAYIPADSLNRLESNPEIYDHYYAGIGRVGLMQNIRALEEAGHENALNHASEMRAAMRFFDRIGWQTPVRLREEQAQN